MTSWSLLKKSIFAMSFQMVVMASTPAHATVYMIDFLGTVSGFEGDASKIGPAALGDPVNLLLRIDDTTPGATFTTTSAYEINGNPAPVTATITIGGQTYHNAANWFSDYENGNGDVAFGLGNQNADASTDIIGGSIINTGAAKSDDFRESGSWYFGHGGTGYMLHETGVTPTGITGDYSSVGIDFVLQYLTVYKEGDPVPPLAVPPLPEPSTWAMMLCGLACVGAVMRQRKGLQGAMALCPPEASFP